MTEGFGYVHAPVAWSVAQASPVTPRTVGEPLTPSSPPGAAPVL